MPGVLQRPFIGGFDLDLVMTAVDAIRTFPRSRINLDIVLENDPFDLELRYA